MQIELTESQVEDVRDALKVAFRYAADPEWKKEISELSIFFSRELVKFQHQKPKATLQSALDRTKGEGGAE